MGFKLNKGNYIIQLKAINQQLHQGIHEERSPKRYLPAVNSYLEMPPKRNE